MFTKAHGYLWTLILFLLLPFTAMATTAIEIFNPSFTFSSDGSVCYLIEDSTPLSIEQLTGDDYKYHFTPYQYGSISSQSTSGHFWLRIPVRNNTANQVTPVLSVDYQLQPSKELYIEKEHSLTEQKNISVLQFDQYGTTSFTLNPNEKATIFLKTRHQPELFKGIRLSSLDQYLAEQNTRLGKTALLSGLLIAIIIANICLSYLSKQNMTLTAKNIEAKRLSALHGYTAINMAFALFFICSWQGYLSSWLNASIELQSLLFKASILFLGLSFHRISVNLLDREWPQLVRFINGLSILHLICLLFIPWASNSVMNTSLSLLMLISTVTFCFSFWLVKREFRPAPPWTFIPLALSQFFYTLSDSGSIAVPLDDATWILLYTMTITMGYVTIPTRFKKTILRQSQDRYKQHHPELFSREVVKQIGHELRTPLNGVMGMTELLQSTSLTPKQEDYVQTLRYSGHELGNLINLLASNIKTNKVRSPSDSQLLNLQDTIDEVTSRLLYRAEQKNVELICSIAEDISSECYFNDSRFFLILEATCFYALNQAENGELILSVKKETVGKMRIELRLPASRYSEHWGSNNDINQDTNEEEVEASSALNLFLAKKLLKEMDGDIVRHTNSINLFTPYTETSKEEPEQEKKNDNEYSQMRVLIADDSSTCRKVLQQQCKLLDLMVDEAEDGLTALAMIRTASYLERPYDVVIADHQMPGLKGIQIAERISQDRNTLTPPSFIMLTGVTTLPNTEDIDKLGISSLLTKPVTRFTVKKALFKILKKTN